MNTSHELLAALALSWVAAAPLAAANAGTDTISGAAIRQATLQGSLADTISRLGTAERAPLWFAWEVPAVDALGNACCFDDRFHHSACRLESRNQGWGSNDRYRERPSSGELRVLARWADGKVGRVRAFSTDCELDAGGVTIVHLDEVVPAASVAYLAALASHDDGRRDEDESLAALAYHAGGEADAALQRLAGGAEPEHRRDQALFWIGQARGETGARYLAGVIHDDPSGRIREKAVFALSQSSAKSAVPTLIAVARHHADDHLRGEALFWLAQTNADEAPTVLLAAVDGDPSASVRKKAVFAISQLRGETGEPLLERLARERRDLAIRREALFWLGQSQDPRALDFLEKVLSQ